MRMTPALRRLLDAFDGHDVEEVRAALADGADPRAPVDGKLPIDLLTEQYTRSDRLPSCLRLLLDAGATQPDPTIIPVLLDDADGVRASHALATHRTTMVSSFTPLVGATALHVAAEYGNPSAARALVEMG